MCSPSSSDTDSNDGRSRAHVGAPPSPLQPVMQRSVPVRVGTDARTAFITSGAYSECVMKLIGIDGAKLGHWVIATCDGPDPKPRSSS